MPHALYQVVGSHARVKLFITGDAGTRKTCTSRVLKKQIKQGYKSDKISVKVCALTRVAAPLIYDSTFH